eukprot:COSAG06_NODE_2587_length_6615_cov_25.876918_4_plen_383_part_00
MHTVCRNVVLRLRNQQVAAAFSGWRQAVERQQFAHELTHRYISRLQNRKLYVAWNVWAQHVAEARQAKRTQSDLADQQHHAELVAEQNERRLRAEKSKLEERAQLAESRLDQAEQMLARTKHEHAEAAALRGRLEHAEAHASELSRALAASKLVTDQRSLSEANDEGSSAEEVEIIRSANAELQVSVSSLMRSLETERLQSEVLAAEKVAAAEKVKKLERRLQRALDAGTAANLHGALWNHGTIQGRSSSFGGVPTGRLAATRRSTINARMLEHGVPSTNEQARRSMTRPPVGSLAVLTEQEIAWQARANDHRLSSRHHHATAEDKREAAAEDKRVALAEAEVERKRELLRARTGSAETEVPPPPSQTRSYNSSGSRGAADD